MLPLSLGFNVVAVAAGLYVIKVGGKPLARKLLRIKPAHTTAEESRAARHSGLPITSGGVVFVGDSLAATLPAADLWTRWHNRAIGGHTVRQVIDRLDEFLSHHPGRLVILAGTNDVLLGRTADAIAADHAELLDRALQRLPADRIAVLSLPPINNDLWQAARDPNAQIPEINARLQGMAVERGCMWLDLHARVVDDHERLDPRWTVDGVHLAAAGYLHTRDIWETAAQVPAAR